MTGKELNRKWQVGAQHALYNSAGTWYHPLTAFPGALFDSNGYVMFQSKEDYLNCPSLKFTKDVHTLNGLSAIPGYVSFSSIQQTSVSPSVVQDEKSHYEGTPRFVKLTKYERDPSARLECIKFYGAACQVCEVDFGKTYGSDVKGLIHVHHLTPLASIGKQYQIDPVQDLRPVCPNCHAVIHSRKPAYTIEQVRAMRSTSPKC